MIGRVVIEPSLLRDGDVCFVCGFHDPARKLPFIQTVIYCGTKQRSDGGVDLVFQPAETFIAGHADDISDQYPPLVFDVDELGLIQDRAGLQEFVDEYCRGC